jgi:hypothetical protein
MATHPIREPTNFWPEHGTLTLTRDFKWARFSGELSMAIVLLAEDDDQVRVLAESYLEEQGHEVLSAGTAPGALALLDKTSELDLLFTNVDLRTR